MAPLLVGCVLAITAVVVDGAVVAGVTTGCGAREECLLLCTQTATQQIIGTTTKMHIKRMDPVVAPAIIAAADGKKEPIYTSVYLH